jgi:hypothetical protein
MKSKKPTTFNGYIVMRRLVTHTCLKGRPRVELHTCCCQNEILMTQQEPKKKQKNHSSSSLLEYLYLHIDVDLERIFCLKLEEGGKNTYTLIKP